MYYCSKCKLEVIVLPGHEPIRACNCEAPIIGEMSGTVYGVSKMQKEEPCQDSEDSKMSLTQK